MTHPPSSFATERLIQHTPETRALWEAYAIAQEKAEQSLLSEDGLQAARAWYAFLEAFLPQLFEGLGVPMILRRRQHGPA